MTSRQLGGACDEVFYARNFEEIANLSKQHGQEMYKKGDNAHINVMTEMQKLMQSPGDMQRWMGKMKRAFDTLPNL